MGFLHFGFCQRHAQFKWNQFRQLIHEVVRQIQYPAHIAHDGFGGHGAEGGDLRYRIRPITFAHIFDYALAPVLAKIHVEVRHRDSFRIQEALEQQVVTQGIKIGNIQAIRDQRTRARTPTRADRHTVVLSPIDKVGHDQKITGETHLDNGLGFEQ